MQEISFFMEEIKLLEEYNNTTEYKNICKILKELVMKPLLITNDLQVIMYMISTLSFLVENKPSTSLDDDIKYGTKVLNDIIEDSNNNDNQKVVTKTIASMYSILLTLNKNQLNVLYFLQLLYKKRPLTPLTDDPDDWIEIGVYDGFKIFRHRRCDKVFKDEKNGVVSYTEGKVFVQSDGQCFINENSSVELRLPSLLPDTEFIYI